MRETWDTYLLPLAIIASVVKALHGRRLAGVSREVQQKVIDSFLKDAATRSLHGDVQLGHIAVAHVDLDRAVLLKLLNFLLYSLNACHFAKWKHFLLDINV